MDKIASFNCRSCGHTVAASVLDLGTQPLANNLLNREDLEKPEPRFKLHLVVCQQCWLMQLLDTVRPVEMFTDYPYFSSTSTTMLDHAARAAARYLCEFRLTKENLVIEIGSNDGYLLQHFQTCKIPCLGIEPSKNLCEASERKGIRTINSFFTWEKAKAMADAGQRADLILANNVFAHCPDPNDFIGGIKTLLKPDGVAIFEFPSGSEMIKKTEFDTIYHEHVFYFTLSSLMPLLGRHGLFIYHAEELPIHGGSLRVFIVHHGKLTQSLAVKFLAAQEVCDGVPSMGFYSGFATAGLVIKKDLQHLLHNILAEGYYLAAYGASAKGSTLLNACEIEWGDIGYVCDRSPHKQGKFTPGTHIPIVSADELVKLQPDYTLLLTWNFAEEILEQQAAYRAAGGKFIIPIPKVTIV